MERESNCAPPSCPFCPLMVVETETGAGVQRTVEQVIDVVDDAEEQAQQRTVEQIVDVPVEAVLTETAPAETESKTLDHESLDVTRAVERPPPRAKAAPQYECSLKRGIRLELERVRYQEQAKRRFKRARERSAERQRQAHQNGLLLEEATSPGRDLRSVGSSG